MLPSMKPGNRVFPVAFAIVPTGHMRYASSRARRMQAARSRLALPLAATSTREASIKW